VCFDYLLVYAKLENNEIQITMTPSQKDQSFLQDGAARAAAMLRAVGNEHRLLVLCLLIEHGEMTVGALLDHVALSQSALSQHLAKMREEGLVAYRRESQTLHYRIENPDVAKLIATLKTIFCP
jgi:DNA-binding transcriptional ArsR family regulator